MYQISDSILKSGVYSALTESTREFQQRISFGEGLGENFIEQIHFEKGITKIEISQEGNSDSGGLVLGSCCASSCVAEFYNPDKTYNYAGKTMFIECGVKYPFEVSYEDKTGGYYMTSNGKWVDGENVYSKVTNLIPVFEGDSFIYTGRGEWGAASVLWYDENKNFLSGEEYYSEDTRDHVATVTIEVPDGAVWAVFQTFDYDSEVTLEVRKANDSFFYIPCGYYKVDKPETDDDWRTVCVTAYDCIDGMTRKWNTSLSMPSNAYLLLEEIATRYRLDFDVESDVLAEMKSRAVTEAEALALTAYTEREVCGFLAGLFGANARINTVGKLAVKRYHNSSTDDFCIPAAVQWQNGFKKTSEEEFVIYSVTSGIDDAVFTAGTGAGISFANPIITEDEISAIYDMYAGMSFQPSSCEWRGNPCIECGDTVAITDRNGNSYTVLVASQVIDLTGGLSMTTYCPGGDAEISFDTVDERTRAALNRQYTALQQAIIDASNALNGARGGYYEVLDNDNDGNPDGWLIKQFQDGSGGLMLANHEGIGLSSDGGKTYRTAIGFGGINADCITTGKLNAERIDTSTLVVGKDNVEGLNTELETLLQAIEEAESKATNAQSTVDATNLILSGITARENGVTVVKGSTILTGSIGAAQIASGAITAEKLDAGAITAEKLNVGWQSGNCATGWSSDKESYITVTSDSSNNNNPKIEVSTSYTSGNIDVNGIPFYASAGDVLRFGGTAYKKSTGDNGVYLKYSSKSDGTYNVVSWQNTATNANGSTVVIDKSYTVTQAGWYMITVAFNKQESGAYVTNLYCYKDVKGEMIVNGKISSVDGKTYFDLDNSEMGCADGYYTSQYASGKLQFKYSTYDIGAIEGYVAQSTAANRRLMIYSPNIIELGIGDSPLNASGSAVTINGDQIGTMKPIWAKKNIRAVNQANINDYIEMTTDSSKGGTLYMQKQIDSSSAAWGYMYLDTDGHVYWYGSIGKVQIA